MDNSLNDLVTLTDAVFQAEMQKMSIVNAQEAEIRKKLSELDDHRQKINLFEAQSFMEFEKSAQTFCGMPGSAGRGRS